MSTSEKDTDQKLWPYSRGQVLNYLSTRLTTLVPHRRNISARTSPIKVLRRVTRAQWLMFLCGMCGRSWDAFDYATVPLTVTELGEQFDAPASAVTWVSIQLLHLLITWLGLIGYATE
jgi:SHS family lactate transporter-like MFS transporter